MTQSARHPSISNINFYAKLCSPIDLDKLTKSWLESEKIVYTLLPIPRILISYGNGIAANISPEGAIVVLGKISPGEADKLVRVLVKKMCMYLKRKLSFMEEPRVASLMGSAKLPFEINFEALMEKVPKCNRSRKNPGIWWKIQNYGVQTVGIFASGSLQLCGAKSVEDLEEAY